MMKKEPKASEILPVSSARLIAIMTVSMSVGFALVAYYWALAGRLPAWSLLVLLGMAFFSSYVAIKRMITKFQCSQCSQPFFNNVRSLFLKPDYCVSCQKSFDNAPKTP